jgi:CheY-like chemotaxis protein
MTGYGQDTDRSKSVEAGFDAHLTKPVETSELMQLLERAVEHATSPG